MRFVLTAQACVVVSRHGRPAAQTLGRYTAFTMTEQEKLEIKARLCAIGALLVPFIVFGLYFYISSYYKLNPYSLYYPMIFISIIPGLYFIYISPTNARTRVILSLLHIPFIGFLLLIYSIYLFCYFFGNCL